MTKFDKIAMTIAGSDSGGGAGIQADLKTFAFHCVHGTSAITCVTAQNTVGVTEVMTIAPEIVVAQIKAITEDINPGAIKTGMLFDREIIFSVAKCLQKLPSIPLVVDPVMVSRTGAKLLDDRAVARLEKDLFPLATIVTPNIYEAQISSKIAINNLEDMQAAAKIIHQKGAKAVLIKGGAMLADLRGVDVFFDGREYRILRTEIVNTKHTHGTGCTLSAAIAANLSLGKDLCSAVEAAKDYITKALKYSLNIGEGTGPVGHFFPLLLKS